ncbi:MAG: ABC transporter permease [Chloroflexota bacterium]|nr:ABC transporter permease [Chloroflexota bacterium]
MGNYIIRRLIQSVGLVFGVSVIVFVLVRLIPGDPARSMLSESASAEQVAAMRQQLGLDRPIPVQYLIFLSQALHGDLGRSLFYGEPTVTVLLGHLPATLLLATVALTFALVVAVPLGVLSAVRRDTPWDYLGMGVAMLGQSIPAFWLGLMLVLVFAVFLRVLPASGIGGPQHLVLPAITLGAYLMSLTARLVRSGLLDVLHEDYVRTARAKGLSDRRVVYGHAMRNVLIPLVTVLGLQIGTLLGGAVITETIFAWPGVGTVVYTAINARDYPLVQAAVLMLSIFFVFINLAVDLLYAYIDPRIHHA